MMTRLLTLRRFARDSRGVAAVEFAFIAPILIVFYLGMAEVCQLLKAKRRVDHAGAAVADLITQEQGVDTQKLTDLKAISSTIMEPLPVAALTVQVYGLKDDASGAAKCEWGWPTACVRGAAPPTPVGTPLNPGEGLIMADVSYAYTSGIGYLITAGKTLTHRAELRPRKNDFIDCSNC